MEARFYMTKSDYDYVDESIEANDINDDDHVDTEVYNYPDTEEKGECHLPPWWNDDEPPF